MKWLEKATQNKNIRPCPSGLPDSCTTKQLHVSLQCSVSLNSAFSIQLFRRLKLPWACIATLQTARRHCKNLVSTARTLWRISSLQTEMNCCETPKQKRKAFIIHSDRAQFSSIRWIIWFDGSSLGINRGIWPAQWVRVGQCLGQPAAKVIWQWIENPDSRTWTFKKEHTKQQFPKKTSHNIDASEMWKRHRGTSLFQYWCSSTPLFRQYHIYYIHLYIL